MTPEETKLRQALTETALSIGGNGYSYKNMIEFATSPAAQAYWAEKNKVDLFKLKQDFENEFITDHPNGDWIKRVNIDIVWDFFAPYLQARESDAAELLEWALSNGWKYYIDLKMWRNDKGIAIIESPTSPLYINTNRLSQEYLKTKK